MGMRSSRSEKNLIALNAASLLIASIARRFSAYCPLFQ